MGSEYYSLRWGRDSLALSPEEEELFRAGQKVVRIKVNEHAEQARKVGVPVCELKQEFFIALARACQKFNPELGHRFEAFVYGFLGRVAKELLQKQIRHISRTISGPIKSETDKEPLIDIVESLADQTLGNDSQERCTDSKTMRCELIAALDQIPADMREALLLAKVEEHTAPEISNMTGTKLNTVYSRVTAAKGILASSRRLKGFL